MKRSLWMAMGVWLLAAAAFADPTAGDPKNAPARLVFEAKKQIGVTKIYDPAYMKIAYPGGDTAREKGVCADVIVRAYRDAFGIDLQKLVHEDMKENFSLYPTRWGLKQPDSNIDHRRVLNLEAFFRRHGETLTVDDAPQNYRAGDIVTQILPPNLPHIVIVSDQWSADGQRPLVIQNIGAGAQLDDTLFKFKITGHYRYGLRL